MDRTIIIPYRAEEKELSHVLHNAIQGLILLHPPTEDLRKCLSDEMFIKPNQQAFFHVMHYLFRLFDPQEFKKRFFWPITDKRSESNFRASTIEYLKHINERYQLNWTNIKSYLVVMPGGMKFICFLLDFVNFIVQELVKQKEKQLNLDASNYRSQVSETNLHRMCVKNELFKDMASEFIDTIESLNVKYDDKTQKLMQHLEILSQESGLPIDLLTDEKYLDKFEVDNNLLYNKIYCDRSEKVLEMNNFIVELKESMDKFYSKETGYKYDKQRIYLQLKRIRDHFTIDDLVEESFGSKITDEGVNVNTLISTYNAINETIQNELKMLNKKPCAGEYLYSRLMRLKKELQEMEEQITNFKKVLHENMKSGTSDFPKTPTSTNVNCLMKPNLENALLLKLVTTPPIKFEFPEGRGKSRLSLVDSKVANTNEAAFNNFLAPPRLSTIHKPNRHHSLFDQTLSDLNNSMNRSKIINPMQLLRSTSKKDVSKYRMSTKHANVSNLGASWKLRQTILNNDEEAPTASAAFLMDVTTNAQLKTLVMNKTPPQLFTKTASVTMLNQPPFTPFSSNDHTTISRSQYQLDCSVIGGDNSSYVNKLSAVRKVQDASLNFANLSTSPSGRLDPLVAADVLDIPKLKLNDISFTDHNLRLNDSSVYEQSKKLSTNTSINNIVLTDENNPISNRGNKQNANKHDQEEEDALFDTSDSVLKDVTL